MKSMQSIVLKHALIAGGILIVAFAATLPFGIHSEVVGYTSMVLAFLLVFFGIRAYREELGGSIGFGKAFQVGILITLVICAIYVISWEIVYWGFMPDFLDKYNAHALAKLRASGATEAAIQAAQAQMATFADGLAVRVAIPYAVDVLQRVVDDMLLVSERQLARAVGRYAAAGIRVEGSAAAGLAALDQGSEMAQPVVLIVTGQNIDEQLYQRAVKAPDSFPD